MAQSHKHVAQECQTTPLECKQQIECHAEYSVHVNQSTLIKAKPSESSFCVYNREPAIAIVDLYTLR